jgi:hypothetical protein
MEKAGHKLKNGCVVLLTRAEEKKINLKKSVIRPGEKMIASQDIINPYKLEHAVFPVNFLPAMSTQKLTLDEEIDDEMDSCWDNALDSALLEKWDYTH